MGSLRLHVDYNYFSSGVKEYLGSIPWVCIDTLIW